MFPKGL